MQHEIDRLNRCLERSLERLTEESSHWREKYLFALISFKEDEARAFLAEDGKLETKVSQEIEHLKMQKKALKAQLKRGQIDNVSYQRSITPINKRIEELEFQLCRFRHDKPREIFPTWEINSETIERYFR
jgi:phage shock protein A